MPKHIKKSKCPMKRWVGESVVETFIADRKLEGDDEIGKLILIEPRAWMDHAVTCVTHDGENGYRAVYDMTKLETLYCMMWQYEEKGYKTNTMTKLYVDSKYRQDDAEEWVSYNTVRGADYMGPSKPLFTRNRQKQVLFRLLTGF